MSNDDERDFEEERWQREDYYRQCAEPTEQDTEDRVNGTDGQDILRVWEKKDTGQWEVFGSYDVATQQGRDACHAAMKWIRDICGRDCQTTRHFN